MNFFSYLGMILHAQENIIMHQFLKPQSGEFIVKKLDRTVSHIFQYVILFAEIKYPRIVGRGRPECFHNGIILIVNCFKLYYKCKI